MNGSATAIELDDLELKGTYDNPNYGQGDDLVTYMCMRDNGKESRQHYLECLTIDRRERLIHERDRIEKLRVKFFANHTKSNLIAKHEQCRMAWRNEAIANYEKNLEDLHSRCQKADGLESEIRRKTFGNEKRILRTIPKWQPSDPQPVPKGPHKTGDGAENLAYDLKACIMHFKKGRGGHTHPNPKVVGRFPDQKISIEDLLSNYGDNPLRERLEDDTYRYFHLPTNNMAWVEKVLQIYYDEDPNRYDHRKAPHLRGTGERLLSREYWRGQMHGGTEHPVHARHMRPRLSSVPSNLAQPTISQPGSSSASLKNSVATHPGEIPLLATVTSEAKKKSPQNFALFMPYLHWETNSRRAKMAKVVSEITKKEKKPNHRNTQPDAKEKARLNFSHAVEQQKLRAKYEDLPGARTKCLGPYLMSIARLVDEMDYEADERLLRDHLHSDPPLHVRRTLDQSYFWTLEDTTARDNDQVVYRGTKRDRYWNTRVIMVDQLWLWILDENTILTSFPRRWGRNKPDPSGVHKSLRERLNQLEDGQINSVFDLALLIIDQCSRVFFDRTKPIDQRPEVMDIFSNAIAYVTGMKTIAFETFWSQMRLDSWKEETSKDPSQQSEKSVRAYLNVNPEGALLRESQDIIEELHMMSRIFSQQIQVIKDFKKALEGLNEREDRKQEQVLLENSNLAMQELNREGYHSQFLRVPKSTLLNAAELLEQVGARKAEIDDLEGAAKRTSQQLQDLLSLKQQQAGIIEARMSLKRADLSIQQGRSIMLFTIVTIIFLPLSFFTGLFGMNNMEWIKEPMSLHRQFKLMFPVAFAVITISLSLAFSRWARDKFRLLLKIPWVLVTTKRFRNRGRKKKLEGHIV